MSEPRFASQHRRSLWMAAVVTIFVTPLVVTLLLYAADPYLDEQLLRSHGSLLDEFITMLAGGVPICAVSMFVIAMPLMLALRSQGWLVLPWVCVVGALAGALGFSAMAYALMRTRMDAGGVAAGGAMGLVAGLVFSLAAGVGFRRKALSLGAVRY